MGSALPVLHILDRPEASAATTHLLEGGNPGWASRRRLATNLLQEAFTSTHVARLSPGKSPRPRALDPMGRASVGAFLLGGLPCSTSPRDPRGHNWRSGEFPGHRFGRIPGAPKQRLRRFGDSAATRFRECRHASREVRHRLPRKPSGLRLRMDKIHDSERVAKKTP